MLGAARKKWFWTALALGLAAVGVAWLYYRGRTARDLADTASARRQGRPLPVRTAPVVQQKVEQVIGGTAVTVPSETATVQLGGSGVSGQTNFLVKKVLARDGAYVRGGQALVALEDELSRLNVKQREAQLAAAQAEVDKANGAATEKGKARKAALAAAEGSLTRARQALEEKTKVRKAGLAMAEAEVQYRKNDVEIRKEHRQAAENLYKKKANDEKAVEAYYESYSKYEKARAELAKALRGLEEAKSDQKLGPLADQEAVAKAEKAVQQARNDEVLGALADQEAVAKAAAALQVAQVHLRTARKDLDECQVRAPLTGLVDGLTVVPGGTVKAHTALGHVLQVDPIFVKMDFPQERLGEVGLGQQADVTLDGFPGEKFSGSVVRIQARVDNHLRVLPVLIRVDNAKQRLRPGITGFVRLRTVKLALVVPATAVFSHGSKSQVFRVEDGRARVREVRPGAAAGTGMVEIQSGLRAGDEVVIYSNFYNDAGSLTRLNAFLQDNDPVDPDWRKWAQRND